MIRMIPALIVLFALAASTRGDEEPSKYSAAREAVMEAARVHAYAQAKVEILEKNKAKAADLKEPKANAKKAKDEFDKAVKVLEKETPGAFKDGVPDHWRQMLNLNITNAKLYLMQAPMLEANAADKEEMRAATLLHVNYLTLYTAELKALPKTPVKKTPPKK